MPHSWNLNAKRTFSDAFDANVAETEASFRQRRNVMNSAWDDLDEHSKALGQRMAALGISKPAGPEEEMLRLNVGGTAVNIRRSALQGRGYLGRLFESVWDERLPRDADGLIVLDHSPKCVKHVIHTLLSSRDDAGSATKKRQSGDGLPADEKAYFPYLATAIGLTDWLPITVTGGSTVLTPDELLTMPSIIQGWCPGRPSGLELVYRATRDGWTPQAFHARCGNDSPSTITLYRVGHATNSAVVGGFSSVSWAPEAQVPDFRSSPGAFLFMLTGVITWHNTTKFQPAKWDIREGHTGHAVFGGPGVGPYFGGDLGMTTQAWNMAGPLVVGNRSYDIPADAPLLTLSGFPVLEMETFRVCYPKSTPPNLGLVDIPAFDASTISTEGGREDDIRSFGLFVADSLMEEKTALEQAHDELAEANAKAAASTGALAALYGPEVAAGKEDSVIELSVRGTRMTTLRSTLQACPDSALATQFDEDKWPATQKDVDGLGRRVVDCSPSVFSKVLDVLRMRKRVAWGGGAGWAGMAGGDLGFRVVVKAADRAAFETFVRMYFPGCESFIMDYVADGPLGATAGG